MASDSTTEVTSKPKYLHHQYDLPSHLPRQPSLLSLTLDELQVQHSLCSPGKNVGSMNIDDFLNNIWSIDETGHTTTTNTTIPPGPLHRQGSLTLPTPLAGKTVEEVWSHIQKPLAAPPPAAPPPQCGEMTLEDFLVKAGVVREGKTRTAAPLAMYPVAPRYSPTYHEYGYQYQVSEVSSGSQRKVTVKENDEVDEEAEAEEVVDDKEEGGIVGNRRKGEEEKGVERRQKRMIKNRESAARSRARKQAYTVELEAELNHMKELNERLKAEQARLERIRRQMILHANAQQSHAEAVNANKKLRRCLSW